jgi:phospholipid/cholesterol/gamma-HCH transport system substrate-binding protein
VLRHGRAHRDSARPDRRRGRVDARRVEPELAYARLQMSKPQTLAHSLNDSPVGLAAWIVEKFRAWGDTNGNVESRFSKDDLITGIKALEPTTRLLEKYSPVLTCMLLGGRTYLDQGGYDGSGGNGKSVILDVSILLGDDPYKYPNNLPKVGAKGGPGGTPSCGSLPDVGKNWPVRQLITDTGWGTGDDWRANPGIGFPGYANYFPVTRANPESPSIRYPDGNAPGPIPYLGAPPYGAPMYSPDGTPLYPGLPPAPPPGAPREPGPPAPGSEPFTVPVPASVQPTPVPPLPVPAVPSP